MKIMTKQFVLDEIARLENNIKTGIAVWMSEKKLKTIKKYLSYEARRNELEFRVATANSLAGYERYHIYQDEVYDNEINMYV